jgi:hypothetical protein
MSRETFGFCDRIGCPQELEQVIVMLIFWYLIYWAGKLVLSTAKCVWPFLIMLCAIISYYYPNMRIFLETGVTKFFVRLYRAFVSPM